MLLPVSGNHHLTYCTNIHPADGWEAVFATLQKVAPALKARFSPDAPFGVGLRLSARDAAELLHGDRLEEFAAFLDGAGLYVAIINGFPYGPFHGTPVKASVYAPDWRHDERVQYTQRLARILARLLPRGLDGGISTAPLSYKAWLADDDIDGWDAVTANVVRVAETLAREHDATGTLLHLDIEPEPDCTLENTGETIDFFERRLFAGGAERLAASMAIGVDRARGLLRDHVRVCVDCCHLAVAFEEPTAAIDRLRAAGIRIGRVQLSSALDVRVPSEPSESAVILDRLRAFADATYLHQVSERHPGRLRQYPDLPEALDAPAAGARHWRIHFHVPLFTRAYERLGSTQDEVGAVIRHVLATGATTHLEIETYTWDVLPPGLKQDVVESIAREYEWVLGQAGPEPPAGTAG